MQVLRGALLLVILTGVLVGPGPIAPQMIRTTAAVASTGTAAPCIAERWAVSTLSDDDAALVDLAPVRTTVAALLALPSPDALPSLSRAAPVELTTYTLTAELVSARAEENGDLSLTVADPEDPIQQLVVRFPDTLGCALTADPTLVARMQQAREALLDLAGSLSTRDLPVAGTAEITGVGMFAAMPTGSGGSLTVPQISLHPVLDFVLH
jgi:hypothetical protein